MNSLLNTQFALGFLHAISLVLALSDSPLWFFGVVTGVFALAVHALYCIAYSANQRARSTGDIFRG